MADGDISDEDEMRASGALPLAEAAARLGVSRDALRMRVRRGKARGVKRGGHLFVWLDDAGARERHSAAAQPRRPNDVRSGSPGGGPWPDLVQHQREEIARLVQETERLNARLDRHLEEAREMREMLQREQVLRQQEQALRRDVQDLLKRVIAQPGLAAALGGPDRPDATGAPPAPVPPEPGANEDLADMLKEIGQSLRALDARDRPDET